MCARKDQSQLFDLCKAFDSIRYTEPDPNYMVTKYPVLTEITSPHGSTVSSYIDIDSPFDPPSPAPKLQGQGGAVPRPPVKANSR